LVSVEDQLFFVKQIPVSGDKLNIIIARKTTFIFNSKKDEPMIGLLKLFQNNKSSIYDILSLEKTREKLWMKINRIMDLKHFPSF
jgi:hypothetical protein